MLARNPFLRDSLLIGADGERIISKVTPSLVHNTVDQPIFPNQGVRYTASVDLAGLGGNTSFYKPSLEGIWFWRQHTRMSLGMRAQGEYIHSINGSKELPIFQKIFSAASIRCAGTTSGASARRIPAPASCSAATRACCSTSSRTSTS